MIPIIPVLPLTILLLGVQFVGPTIETIPGPSFKEPTMICGSIRGDISADPHKMPVDFSLGELMSFVDRTVGVACDTSSGLTFDGTLGLPSFQTYWQPIRT